MAMPMGRTEIYPSFRIDLEHLPEAKDWKVGSNYRVTLDLKQVGLHVGKNEYDNSAEFEIHGIETDDNKKSGKKAPRYKV